MLEFSHNQQGNKNGINNYLSQVWLFVIRIE